jgi:2-polyprenyl-3-methyl-5-hydroxy-6-metoxy-1,4-benzoquinol methylase
MNNEEYYKKIRPEIAQILPARYRKVLEIGCAEGGFKENLNECEYWRVEPNQEVAEIANKRLFKVFHGTFDDVYQLLPKNYFDLVICNDVIEHMSDHYSFYENIRNVIKNDAYMIGSIPNVRYIGNLKELLIDKDWCYRDSGILDKTHLRFFTKKSIYRDFERYNFQIELLKGINGIDIKSLYNIKLFILSLFLGSDTRYLQFSFRVKILR